LRNAGTEDAGDAEDAGGVEASEATPGEAASRCGVAEPAEEEAAEQAEAAAEAAAAAEEGAATSEAAVAVAAAAAEASAAEAAEAVAAAVEDAAAAEAAAPDPSIERLFRPPPRWRTAKIQRIKPAKRTCRGAGEFWTSLRAARLKISRRHATREQRKGSRPRKGTPVEARAVDARAFHFQPAKDPFD